MMGAAWKAVRAGEKLASGSTPVLSANVRISSLKECIVIENKQHGR